MEFNKDYYKNLSLYRNEHLRAGQAIFSKVQKHYPKEVNYLIDTKYDCFNDDTKIDSFLEKIKQLVEFPKEGIEVKLLDGKPFYRLGESMKTRKLRGDKV